MQMLANRQDAKSAKDLGVEYLVECERHGAHVVRTMR